MGAGWGGLAQVFSRDARYQYIGFEPSADRAAFCRARDFYVRADCSRAALRGEADIVIFDNVLEHVDDPRSLVRHAVDVLVRRGLLVIIVPKVFDIRRIHPRWRERRHWQSHCHINYFSARHLKSMFMENKLTFSFFGFEAVGSVGDDLGLLPRGIADRLGIHLFGLNCYGIKAPQRTA